MTLEELLNVLILVDFDRSVIPILDFYPKKLPCDPQILHLKPFAEALLDRGDFTLVFPGNNEIIDIEGDICSLAICILMNPDAGV